MTTISKDIQTIGTRSKKRRLSDSTEAVITRSEIDGNVSNNQSKRSTHDIFNCKDIEQRSNINLTDVTLHNKGLLSPCQGRKNGRINNENMKKTHKNMAVQEGQLKAFYFNNTESQNSSLWSSRCNSEISEESDKNCDSLEDEKGYDLPAKKNVKKIDKVKRKSLKEVAKPVKSRAHSKNISSDDQFENDLSSEEPDEHRFVSYSMQPNNIQENKSTRQSKKKCVQNSQDATQELFELSQLNKNSKIGSRFSKRKSLTVKDLTSQTDSSSPNGSEQFSGCNDHYKGKSFDSNEVSNLRVSSRLANRSQVQMLNKRFSGSSSDSSLSLIKPEVEKRNKKTESLDLSDVQKEKNSHNPGKTETRCSQKLAEIKTGELETNEIQLKGSNKKTKSSKKTISRCSDIELHLGSSWDPKCTPPRRFSLRLLEKSSDQQNCINIMTPQSNLDGVLPSLNLKTPPLRKQLKKVTNLECLAAAKKNILKIFDATESDSSEYFEDSLGARSNKNFKHKRAK